jgi:hypothetical protein
MKMNMENEFNNRLNPVARAGTNFWRMQAGGETEGGKRRVATIAADRSCGGNAGKPGQSVFSKIESTKLIERRNMIAYIYRPKRQRTGKLISDRIWRA